MSADDKRCETCRFMAAERDPWRPQRTCVRVIHGNHYEVDDNIAEKELAIVTDGSGYAARLLVLPTFGCVLHEPHPQKDGT